jgi:hypothetical protein
MATGCRCDEKKWVRPRRHDEWWKWNWNRDNRGSLWFLMFETQIENVTGISDILITYFGTYDLINYGTQLLRFKRGDERFLWCAFDREFISGHQWLRKCLNKRSFYTLSNYATKFHYVLDILFAIYSTLFLVP